MAERRNTPKEDLKKIEENEAVAEAFGYYFDRHGEVIHKVHSVGIQLEDLDSIPNIIAVAGGSSKADAIEAYFKKPRNTVLITDEGAAKQLGKFLGVWLFWFFCMLVSYALVMMLQESDHANEEKKKQTVFQCKAKQVGFLSCQSDGCAGDRNRLRSSRRSFGGCAGRAFDRQPAVFIDLCDVGVCRRSVFRQ